MLTPVKNVAQSKEKDNSKRLARCGRCTNCKSQVRHPDAILCLRIHLLRFCLPIIRHAARGAQWGTSYGPYL
jgi:hypothetical protein